MRPGTGSSSAKPRAATSGGPRYWSATRTGRRRFSNGWISGRPHDGMTRSEEHTSELQSLMRTSYAVFCLKKNKDTQDHNQAIQSKADTHNPGKPTTQSTNHNQSHDSQ